MGNSSPNNKIIINKLDIISKKIDTQNHELYTVKSSISEHSNKINELDNKTNIIDEKINVLQNSMDQWSEYYLKNVHPKIFTNNDTNNYFNNNVFELSNLDYGEDNKRS